MKRLIIAMTLFSSSLAFACGLHQETGFSFVSEPGSLEVFEKIIISRQQQELGNPNKPDHFKLFSIKAALGFPHPERTNFVLFQAIKGHYSQVSIEDSVSVSGLNEMPEPDDLMLVTEFDVLDALSTGLINWDEAKQKGLVTINGDSHKAQQLDAWFASIFS